MNINDNGGYYENGVSYDMGKKMEVLQAYLSSPQKNGRDRVNLNVELVAKTAMVSVGFAHKVITEYLATGALGDPKGAQGELAATRKNYTKLGPEESIFLLALRAEDDTQLLVDYKQKLFQATGVAVSCATIDRFFKNRFEHSGSLRKAPLVPLDKWRPANLRAYHSFMATIAKLPVHNKYHFIDEKHVVNKDVYGNRVRADPLTGRVRCIFVNGNFRQAFNLISIIRLSGDEPPMHYSIGEENGTAASFTAYIELLISINWFKPGDVLIMDNAAIHTGREASIVADILWEFAQVVVVPLPTRSPELNPIELIFHILARWLRAYRYRATDLRQMTIPQQVAKIVETITTETVWKCAGHCGY